MVVPYPSSIECCSAGRIFFRKSDCLNKWWWVTKFIFVSIKWKDVEKFLPRNVGGAYLCKLLFRLGSLLFSKFIGN